MSDSSSVSGSRPEASDSGSVSGSRPEASDSGSVSGSRPEASDSGSVSGSRPEASDRGLTHLDESGQARMVDVGAKEVTDRVATARAEMRMRPETARRLAAGDLPKGDALPVARVAGIQAAKRTADLIPLCHQVALSSVTVDATVDAGAGRVEVLATARAADRTGVEMEALTAASVAALALYDMVKGVERGVVIGEVALLEKSGGARGDWERDA